MILREYGVQCSISPEELLVYLRAPSYEDDTVKLDEIINNKLLLLHEIAEICFLKEMGYKITRNIVIEAYPDTYYAHLEALRIELAEAGKLGRHDWIARQCIDLVSYLDDPYLPSSLESTVYKLITRYCNMVEDKKVNK